MIVERAIFAIKPGTAKEFAAAFALARPHIEGSKGFRKIEMRQGMENPDTWLLLVWWDTVDDHMKGFRKSPPSRNGASIWGRSSPVRPRSSITRKRSKSGAQTSSLAAGFLPPLAAFKAEISAARAAWLRRRG